MDISKKVQRYLKLVFEGQVHKFLLSHKDVHDTCALYGKDDHHLRIYPIQQPACSELVLAKLKSSSLNPQKEASTQQCEWTKILSKAHGKALA